MYNPPFTYTSLLLSFVYTAEECNTDKRIGFFKGLKATWGFKPYFYLLMLELFSWLALQVSKPLNSRTDTLVSGHLYWEDRGKLKLSCPLPEVPLVVESIIMFS